MQLYHVEINGLSGFINELGVLVISPQFESLLSTYFTEGLCPFEVDGKCGYIDESGSTVIKPIYRSAQDFSEGLGAVCNEDGNWGYVDPLGIEAIACKYEDACGFSDDGWATVQLNGKWGYIERSGSFVIEPLFDEAFDFDGSLARVEYQTADAYINRTGDVIWSSLGESRS